MTIHTDPHKHTSPRLLNTIFWTCITLVFVSGVLFGVTI